MVLRDTEDRAEANEARWWPEFRWLDWLCLGVISGLLIHRCVVLSHSRLFWSDENFSFLLLRDPVLAHTLHGWWEGSDSGGLLYYLIGHVWFRIFGASPLVMRLYATTSFLVAITIIWGMARRFFSAPIVAIATALTFFLPAYLIWQEINGRFYGLFLASAAFAAACTMYAVERRTRSTALWVLLCCANACLIGSHLLGVVYSVGLLTALIISDVRQSRVRPALYGSVLLAWVVMIPLSYHSIRATATTAQGVFWPLKPLFRDLVLGFFSYSRKLLLLSVLLLVVALVRHFLRRSRGEAGSEGRSPWYSLYVVSGGLILGQLAIFLKSRVGVSIYSDRYLLPLVIALVILLCAEMTSAFGPAVVRQISRPIPALLLSISVLGACFAFGSLSHTYDQLYAGTDYPAKMEGVLPPEKNVVVTLMPEFMMLRLFDPNHHYIFATDWKYDGAIAGADLSGQRMMENVARGGFAPHEVLDLPEIVREYPEFTLVTEPGRMGWLRDRLEQSGDFSVTKVGSLEDWYPVTVWQVRCVHPGVGCGG